MNKTESYDEIVVEPENEPQNPVDYIATRNQLAQQLQTYTESIFQIREQMKKLDTIAKVQENLKKEEQKREEKSQPSGKRNKNQTIHDSIGHLVYKSLVKGDKTWDTIAKEFEISKGSVANIKRKFDANANGQPPKKKQKTGPKSIFDNQDVVVKLLEIIESNPGYTLKKIVEQLGSNNIQTTVSTVDRFLKKIKITWKVAYKIPIDWNTKQIMAKRVEYINQLSEIALSRELIFVDESGFHLTNLTPGHARSLEGTKATLTVLPKSRRLNVISALRKNGTVFNKYITSTMSRRETYDSAGGTNGEDFRSFLLDLTKDLNDCVIVMDNAKIHHAKLLDETVWPLLKQTKKIDHLFLPPYSPFLNPIELLFHSVKTKLTTMNFGPHELKSKVEELFQTTTAVEAQGYFNHAEKYYRQCKVGLPFNGSILSPDVASC